MSVFSDMKSIMVHTFEESNDSFPTNLLSPILASVKKNNEVGVGNCFYANINYKIESFFIVNFLL